MPWKPHSGVRSHQSAKAWKVASMPVAALARYGPVEAMLWSGLPSSTRARSRSANSSAYACPTRFVADVFRKLICRSPSAARMASTSRASVALSWWCQLAPCRRAHSRNASRLRRTRCWNSAASRGEVVTSAGTTQDADASTTSRVRSVYVTRSKRSRSAGESPATPVGGG
ncbi:hypothetical protein [Micromonospora olivasterospora]|uniref:hypothetical protein n=1 Tax=Micromonospora olivasterospora TaxID=1880 RepID=UPI0011A3DC8D